MDHHHRPILALWLRILSGAAFAVMLVLAKLGGQLGVGVFETMFWRQFVPMLGLLAWLVANGQVHRLRTRRPGLHAARGLVGTANMFLALSVIRLMPLAEATVLGFTTPVFAVILSYFVLKERVGYWRLAAVALGLAGVLVIAGPDHAHVNPLGLAAGLASAMGSAIIAIQVRQMALTEEPITVVFWFSATGTVLLLPLLVIYGGAHTLAQWLTLVGVGVSGLAGQWLMTASLRFGTVSSVVVMDYVQLGWATLWGWLVFAQLPPIATWLGSPLIIAAGLIIVWREQRLRRPLTQLVTPAAD